MQDVPIRPEEARDPAEKRQPGIGMGRDPERTPMPWDNSPQCSFTTAEPWLPIGEANRAVNVESSLHNSGSILALYRRLLALRRAEPVLVSGRLTDVAAGNGVLQFVRSDGRQHFRVLLNLSEQAQQLSVEAGAIVACTALHREDERVSGTVHLPPAEALIIRVLA